MAKRRNQSDATDSFELAPEVKTAEVSNVEIQAPLAPLRERVHIPTEVEVRLDPPQSKTLRRLYDGLVYSGAALSNGNRVQSPGDSIRYLLEQLA